MTFSSGVLSGAADRLISGPDPAFDRPDLWAQTNVRLWDPAFYQDTIMQALARFRKVSVIGPHGLGKTAIDAVIVFWFALTRELAGIDWKVVTTAGAWRQLQRYLWPELHKWSRRLKAGLWKDALHTLELKLQYGQAFAVASDDPANIEGAHADEILYIIDEAKNVPPNVWDAIEGAMAAGNAYCLANSTPGKAEGRLYEIHTKRPGYEDWYTIEVSLEDAIKAGRIRPEWAEARRRQWGETSPVYINRVLGRFSTTDSDGVIPLEWITAANDRWADLRDAGKLRALGLTAVAADVATEEGIDKTVVGTLHGYVLSSIEKYAHVDTMKTAGAVKNIIDVSAALKSGRKSKAIAVIDAIGVGTGVVDRLREQGIKVDAFQGSSKARFMDKTGELRFLNRRAEAWWHLRDLLNPAFEDFLIAIPGGEDEPELLGDLIAPKFEQLSSGFIKIEEKDDIRKRLGRSPDVGDMATMLYNARLDRQLDLAASRPVILRSTSKWKRGAA